MNEYATDEFCDLFKKFLELNVRGEGRLDIYAFLLSHEGQVRWSEIRENFSNYATGTSSTALFDLENCGLIKCVSIKTENGLVSAYEITDKGKLFGPIILPEKEDIEKVLLSTFIVVLEKIQKGELEKIIYPLKVFLTYLEEKYGNCEEIKNLEGRLKGLLEL